jgi:hypothetical protein
VGEKLALAKSIAYPNDAGPLALRRGVGAQPTLKLAAFLRLSRILQHGRYALLIDAYCRCNLYLSLAR